MVKKKRQIFRTEVIEAMTARHGEVILIRPVSFSVIMGFILCILFMVLLFLSFGEYTRSIPVKGVLKSYAGDTEIMAYQPGVIEQMYIKEGAVVKQGDPIYKIRTDKQGKDGSVNNKLIDSITGSIALINKKINYQQELNKLEVEDITRAVATYRKKAVQTVEEIEIKKDYMKLLRSELSIISKLKASQQASQVEYNAKYAQVLEARLALKSLVRSRIELIDQAETSEKTKRNIKLQGKSMIVGYQQSVADLERDLANIESQQFYIINAPNSGIVANVLYRQGHFVEINKPLMVLLPEDDLLVAEIYIPTSAIGQMEVGQAINLKYHAFPYQKFGLFEGEISSISKTLIKPFQAEVEDLVQGPSYKATVALKNQNIGINNKKAIHLQTGMLLDADVIGDTRTMFGWIFEPVISLISRN
ncbi:HlyD family secretion protein [Pseudoalteromonas denitrificans]|jgi:membrane fusion protein|uniref:Biotin-lipoyl like n=1 Tax=Pseudoalteromonas denitrificans DSM 6059 TaxID=1123010 RepID=A0A1I1JQB3_9GAMM|nr:HlyD family efflux transporter periplasmic adaptor subunit [Pseudoalteromonas denitrificans]SFC48728.1 Biotin-lipoyl like [Pseudoalteromonas denitrificans DSM 6059]